MNFFFIFFLIMIGCEELGWSEDDIYEELNSLDLYDIWKQNTDLEEDENGYFHFPFQPTGISDSDYGTVKYFTELPITRVFWDSPDEFCIDNFGNEICEPIICCSTYSGSDGYGQQLFYIDETHISDTLTIYGYISENLIDSIFVIVENP